MLIPIYSPALRLTPAYCLTPAHHLMPTHRLMPAQSFVPAHKLTQALKLMPAHRPTPQLPKAGLMHSTFPYIWACLQSFMLKPLAQGQMFKTRLAQSKVKFPKARKCVFVWAHHPPGPIRTACAISTSLTLAPGTPPALETTPPKAQLPGNHPPSLIAGLPHSSALRYPCTGPAGHAHGAPIRRHPTCLTGHPSYGAPIPSIPQLPCRSPFPSIPHLPYRSHPRSPAPSPLLPPSWHTPPVSQAISQCPAPGICIWALHSMLPTILRLPRRQILSHSCNHTPPMSACNLTSMELHSLAFFLSPHGFHAYRRRSKLRSLIN